MNDQSVIARVVSGWPFPVFVLSVLATAVVLLVVVLLTPPGSTGAAAFATDFKVWCFGYDPLTGSLDWSYVGMYFVQPLIIFAVLIVIWGGPLKDVMRSRPAKAIPVSLAGVVTMLALTLFLPSVSDSGPVLDDSAKFEPAGLRTSFMAPSFELTDQDGRAVALKDYRDHIVLVTGIYTSCGDTCPLIIQQIHRVLRELGESERSRVHVLAITLDPRTDTPDMMKALLSAHGVDRPGFRGLTGDPDRVTEILDRYEFARANNPETGAIVHANLINVVDPEGRLAFRFTLGDRQEKQLLSSLEYLLAAEG